MAAAAFKTECPSVFSLTPEKVESVTSTSKIVAEIQLNLEDISTRYWKDDEFFGMIELDHAGLSYQMFLIFGSVQNSNFKYMGFLIPRAKDANITFNVKVTSVTNKIVVIDDKEERQPSVKNRRLVAFDVLLPKFDGKVASISGKISLTMEPGQRVLIKQTLNNKIVKKLCEGCLDLQRSNDFKIICKPAESDQDAQNEDGIEKDHSVVKFNKDFLIRISEVFRRMIENPNTKESQDGTIKMMDTNAKTLMAFKMAFDHEMYFHENCLTVDLMMFGHKYDVPGLVDLCSDYIGNNLKKDTILEVIKAAYFIEDSRLFKKAVAFLMTNLGKIEETPEWKELKKCHPDCFMKITEIMLFEHKFSETLKFQ